jgi:hypothetical protein
MPLWFLRKRRHPSVALTGAPEVRRQKSYSAQSGYVYQYYYEGQRPAEAEAAIEFVFSVSGDRKTWFHVSVLLGEEACGAWERSHGRSLNSTERYAIAKMSLFQAFDERPAPDNMKEAILVRPLDVEGILETLGLD